MPGQIWRSHTSNSPCMPSCRRLSPLMPVPGLRQFAARSREALLPPRQLDCRHHARSIYHTPCESPDAQNGVLRPAIVGIILRAGHVYGTPLRMTCASTLVLTVIRNNCSADSSRSLFRAQNCSQEPAQHDPAASPGPQATELRRGSYRNRRSSPEPRTRSWPPNVPSEPER